MSSPASVSSSADPSSQLAQVEGPAPSQEDVKMEVKKQEEDDEGADSQEEGKGKMGKGEPDVKSEEQPEVNLPTLTHWHSCLNFWPKEFLFEIKIF